jgi:hypothetical protein
MAFGEWKAMLGSFGAQRQKVPLGTSLDVQQTNARLHQ